MVDLQSRVLSQASFPCSLPTSSDIDFCIKKSSLFAIKRFFYTYCALKVKDFHFFHETVSYFVYAKIYKSGKNFCLTMSVCISDIMPGVTLQWTTLPSRGCSSNTSKYFMLQKPAA